MCGICGYFAPKKFSHWHDPIHNMNAAIAHRGPNDSGVWREESVGMTLGHQRLAIVDLTPAGHQPMISQSGRFVLIFNGEIYNHKDIRKQVQGTRRKLKWRGHSDTETLLEAFEAWGIEATLKRTVGMFAIAIWDREKRSLTLARDRMGEKPIYYGWQGESTESAFLFGSELKALKAHPSFQRVIDRGALSLFLRHNCIPAPYSIYENIYKLPAGHLLELNESDLYLRQLTKSRPYWSLVDIVRSSVSGQAQVSDKNAINQLDTLLRNSIRQQMVADVPLGAFLSGGIDSTTVVALMQAQSSRPVSTFSVGFHEAGYNEAMHAKAIAKHLGTEHTELYVNSKDVLAVIPKLPTIYDEPFSDSSQVPTFLVSEMTRRHVTVSLSGDGGDELFGGYNRYFKTEQWWNKIRKVPFWMRHLVAQGLLSVDAEVWDRTGSFLASVSKSESRWGNLSHKITKLSGVLNLNDTQALYRHFTTHWPFPDEIVINGGEPSTFVTQPPLHLDSAAENMMVLDTLTYLPDDILTKIDRAAMAVGLETRVPMLDHRVVEFAWSLPLSMKIRNGQGKWLLRQVLYKYIPKEFVERPKMGFGVPIDGWLRGPLRDWADSLLDESRLRQEGFFNPAPIRQIWAEHLSGKRNWQYHLWDVLMFQAWLEKERVS